MEEGVLGGDGAGRVAEAGVGLGDLVIKEGDDAVFEDAGGCGAFEVDDVDGS